MSSFDTTPLNLYLISFFSLAVIAVVFAIVVAATEVGRHYRTTRAGHPSGAVGSASGQIADVAAGLHGSTDNGEARTSKTIDGTESNVARC